MNSEQSASIVLALEAAIRAGFAITIEPATTGGTSVTVHPKVIRSGAASRVEKFTVARNELRDALGNALGVVVLEIGLDREASAGVGNVLTSEMLAAQMPSNAAEVRAFYARTGK